jgi:hypothetical protein
MAEHTEVSAKLVLDDAASGAIEHIKSGFEHVGEKVHEVQSELGAMLRQTIAVAAGFQLSGAIESVKELGHEIFGAAAASEEQVKSLAGLIAMTDKTGASFEDTMRSASELKDDLEKIGITSGVSADQVIDAFETIAVRSQKSTEEIKEMTNQMTIAGRALPGGVQTLASAYRDLESGIVRPRNALVQLIRQTGTAQGTAKDIAKGLSQMVQNGQMDKAFDLANTAIGKMSDKMKNAPLSFKGVIQSIKDIRENIFESMGLPLLTAITPQLDRLRVYLIEHKAAIEEFAQSAVVKVGTWVTFAANKIAEGFHYIQSHADQIERAFTKGADFIKKAFDFILAHKEEIAVALGAKSLMGAGKSALGPAKAVGGIVNAVMSGGGAEAAAALGPELLVALPAAAAAAIALGGAFDVLTDTSNTYNAFAIKLWEGIKSDFTIIMSEFEGEFIDMKPYLKEFADLMGIEMLASIRGLLFVVKGTIDQVKSFEMAIKSVIDFFKEKFHLKLPELMPDEEVKIKREEMEVRSPSFVSGVKKTLEKSLAMPPNFNVGTINVKQDFRDQDPDRIAVIFKNDLARAATNRMGARTLNGPFGAL